jgi:hypothetical protein
MMTEKQLKNLRPFSATHQPKVYGKRGASPLTTIKRLLVKNSGRISPLTQEIRKLTWGEVLATEWLIKAIKGDNEALRDILDRVDGKSNGEGNGVKIINIVYGYRTNRTEPVDSSVRTIQQ